MKVQSAWNFLRTALFEDSTHRAHRPVAKRDVWSRGSAATRRLLVTALEDGILDAELRVGGASLQRSVACSARRAMALAVLGARVGQLTQRAPP